MRMLMPGLAQDLGYSVRYWRKHPGFTAVALITLALAIGVRVALGARRGDILTMILRQGLRTILVGIVIGLAAVRILTRTLQSLLFGVTASDPLTLAAVIVLLATVALLACYTPARVASRVDPMVALRYE
jgi:putative ABC transport system permease protein